MGNAGSSSPSSPDFRCYGDDCPPCGIFEGKSGKAVVLTLTFLLDRAKHRKKVILDIHRRPGSGLG